MSLNIGIIEFGYHRPEVSSMEVIDHVFEYVVECENLGFSRFWITEHHDNFKTSPWSDPTILLPLLLGNTSKIRVGAAGLLINYHSPYTLALHFKLLANIFPERVDFGFANGTPPYYPSKMLLQSEFEQRPDNFLKHAALISKYYHDEMNICNEHQMVIPPVAGFTPSLFLLGSSFRNTSFALEHKLNYSKSLFHDIHSLKDESETVKKFKDDFFQIHHTIPAVNIAVPILLIDDEREAKKMIAQTGHSLMPNSIIGNRRQIEDKLFQLQEMFACEEIILLDISYDPTHKKETIHQISETFKLLEEHESKTF